MANKVYELVTEQIIHQLETAIQQGSPAPWCKPWNCNTTHCAIQCKCRRLQVTAIWQSIILPYFMS